MAQIQEMQKQEARENANMLSPIPETDSNQMTTLDSAGQTMRSANQSMRSSDTVQRNVTICNDEERKLTGTGKYNLDDYDDDYDNDDYSDDFESDDEEESETGSSIVTAGCSGSTLDTTAQRQAQASSANQAHELERVV